MTSNPKSKLSERERDLQAMMFWESAGKPEGQYPVYRKALERWSEACAIENEFDHYLHELRKSQAQQKNSWRYDLPKSWAWPWISVLVIPMLVGAIVFSEIRAHRLAVQINTYEREEAQEKIFEVEYQRERLQILTGLTQVPFSKKAF